MISWIESISWPMMTAFFGGLLGLAQFVDQHHAKAHPHISKIIDFFPLSLVWIFIVLDRIRFPDVIEAVEIQISSGFGSIPP